MSVDNGVFVSNSDVYDLLQDVRARVIAIETKSETVQADSERIRRIQSQVSAQWVIHTLLLTYIVSSYITQ